ncbi:MAG: hypothetical protein IKD90_07265 [Clostridiales bacterium]|nr:hypothetical protein [Clostridiales bacterium]
MAQIPAQGYFYPYDSIDELYCEKQQPEFGQVKSLWKLDLPKWKFFHARSSEELPGDFMSLDYNDDSWDVIDVPSVWQQEGYGYPSELVYEKNALLAKRTSRLQQRLADSVATENDNEVGVYRVWINLPEQYVSRFVYFMTDGIVGRYKIYVNGQSASSSRSTFSTTKCLLNDYIHEGNNLIVVQVYRFDKNQHDKIMRAQGAFGFSGLFRLPYIVAEAPIEISSVRLTSTWLTDTLARDVVPKTALISSLYRSGISDSETDREKEILPNADIRNDAGMNIQVELRNHLEYDYEVTVNCRLMEAREEYDLYNLPEHRLTQRKELKDLIPKEGVKILGTEFYAKLVLPWTDQTPNLYDIIIEVKNKNDEVICVKKQRFGFRTISYSEEVIHINDVAVPLHGVKYYEFDPQSGISVPLERYRQDILMMKQANINTIFVMHHPTDPRFFDLCDQYGMYVIVQSAAAVLPLTVYSLINHPCIIMWSMTGKKFEENAYMEVKEKISTFDAKRPIYCEIDRYGRVSDLPPFPNRAGMLFGEWCDLCLNRPYLRSRLKKDKVLFDSIIARPRRPEDQMDLKYIHQGDLVEYAEQIGVSIAQGIVDANRKPHPIFYEVKKQCESIKIFSSADNPANLTIHNVQQFGYTPSLVLHWQLLLGGLRLTGGSGVVPPISALGNREMQFPFNVNEFISPSWWRLYPKANEIYQQAVCKELVLDIHLTLETDTNYARSGHEVAFYQQVLLDEVCDPKKQDEIFEDNYLSTEEAKTRIIDGSSKDSALIDASSEKKVEILTAPAFIYAKAGNVTYGFSRQEGGLCSIRINGEEFFDGLFIPSFYRAATNIDRADKSYVLSQTVFSHETDWRTIQSEIKFESSFYEMDGKDFHLICKYKSSGMRGPILVDYRVHPDGVIATGLSFVPKYDLVRYGFRVPILPQEMIGWYGRGSGESYVDRKESQRIGWFTSVDSPLYHEYARPSENGGHADTRVLVLQHDHGLGVKVYKEHQEPFSFSCIPYVPEDLDDYAHQELIPVENEQHLYIDFYMKGIERSPDVVSKHGLSKNTRYDQTVYFAPKF